MTTTTARASTLLSFPVHCCANGYWTHPDHPGFDEGQGEEAKAWFDAQQFEVCVEYLERESADHPAYVNYWDEGDPNISAWEPPRPAGDGWFILSIHDTEDWGPVCVWVRHSAQRQGDAA